MDHRRKHPWAGLGIALATAAGMLASGAEPWLTLTVLVLWTGSLWLLLPDPAPFAAEPDFAGAAATARRDLLGPVGTPLVLIEGQRIVEANQAARSVLGAHILGQDARIVLRHPEAIRLLDLGDDGTVTIPGFTGGRSLWQLTRRRVDETRWLIELRDRTTEADVSRAHTDFVANASHELRTPLAAIIGYIETLIDAGGKVDPATSLRFHETVLREARRMQVLVSDLMSLSQVEAEKHDLPDETVDLARLIERVAGEATALAGKGRVEVTVPDAPVNLRGDRAQLEQLVRNLIDNALKYGDAQAPVRVTLQAEGPGSVRLAVADNGAGIAPEHLPHLTRRFYRTDPGRSRAAGGTGLGLAIVKHIVERHRGQLDIASTLGVGTTVSARFSPVS
ncbi:two-component sensor histidine kinase [Novosphingobium flavum]|uniref:histidine kinase n=1 Tax=Novosphingobium flavum TaxID=1778672 RepID=A0A7X1FQ36_9SPHN|nr:ATP-binding protein [Novosphingobium flavum]MBC2664823.1 two-component sensor histidine kinase [Novosphingobium flavum]